jgi:hypothetical protein
LATLIVCCAGLCVVLAAGTAWYRSHEKEHARHVAVAEELRARGATPTFTWQGPNWLKLAFGERDVFSRVTHVHCSSTLTPQIMDGISRLGSPVRLSVVRRSLNEEALVALAKLENVASISINYVDFAPTLEFWDPGAALNFEAEGSPGGRRYLAAVERDFASLKYRLRPIELTWWLNDP